jgi:MFS family permease
MISFINVGSTHLVTLLLTRVSPRLPLAAGFLLAGLGMLLLTRMEIDSSYAALLLPAQLLLGLGMGTAFMPAMSLATYGVEPRDAGVASAMVNTSQQVGGAIGTALLNTVAASATTAYIKDHIATATSKPAAQLVELQGMVHGYTNAIWFAVAILAFSATIAFTFVNTGKPDMTSPSGTGETEGAVDEVRVPVVAH